MPVTSMPMEREAALDTMSDTKEVISVKLLAAAAEPLLLSEDNAAEAAAASFKTEPTPLLSAAVLATTAALSTTAGRVTLVTKLAAL
jgi:hypothetical protein